MIKKFKIKELAQKAGFDICRITDEIEFTAEKDILKKRKKTGFWPSPFFNKDINEVCEIKQIFPDAETAVVLAVSYQRKSDDNPHLSKYIGKNDYHRYIDNMMESLIEMLQKEAEKPFKYQKFVDTAPFMERPLARNSGLGFTGKNSFIINPEYGSFIFLAEIILNLKIEPDQKLNIECGSCRKCIDSCPAGAIIKPYLTDFSRCISYLTQKRGILTLKERKIIGKNIWGCDLCQDVCPYNKNIKQSRHPELKLDKSFAIEYFINIDRKNPPLELKEMALTWRGFRILQRNALIAAANLRDENYFNVIKNKLKDRSPIIRFYAVWALMEINEKKAYKILKNHLYIEVSKEVKSEIKRLLNDKY